MGCSCLVLEDFKYLTSEIKANYLNKIKDT